MRLVVKSTTADSSDERCLLFVVVGAGLSSFAASDISTVGLALLFVSNVSFATRAIVYKRVKTMSGLNSFELFYYISRNGVVLLSLIGAGLFVADAGNARFEFRQAAIELNSTRAGLLLVNGLCYFSYLQLSIVVLSQVSAITHGVMNSMRRPVNIAVSTVVFQRSMTLVSFCGIAVACVGSLLYSTAQARAASAISSKSRR